MFKSKLNAGFAVVSALVLVLSFQNCAKMKGESVGTASDSSSSVELPHTAGTATAVLAAYGSSANQISDALSLATNTSYTIKLELDNLVATNVSWSASTGDAQYANCSVIGTDLLMRSLSCTSVGKAHVSVYITYNDGTNATRIFEHTVAASQTVLPPGAVVTFNIVAGTGNNPWNTVANPVVVFKGQTLHVVNLDSQRHRVHTSGSPCMHQPADMLTNGSYDCVIAAAKPTSTNTMYDHDVAPSAAFYVNAIDGAATYTRTFNIGGVAKSCASCHGALATSTKRLTTLAKIKGAIASNSGGMNAIVLTDDELNAIVYELNK